MGSDPDPACAPRRPSSRRGKPGRAADGSGGLAAALVSTEPPDTAGGRADDVPDAPNAERASSRSLGLAAAGSSSAADAACGLGEQREVGEPMPDAGASKRSRRATKATAKAAAAAAAEQQKRKKQKRKADAAAATAATPRAAAGS